MWIGWDDWRKALRSAPLPIAPYGRRALAANYIRQTGINLIVTAFAFVLCLPLIVGKIPYRLDLIWALLFGTLIYLGIQRYRHRSGRTISVRTADSIFKKAPRHAALAGLMWGSTAIFLPYLEADYRTALPIIGIGLCVGATATLSATPRAARAYILAVIIPYIIHYVMRASLPDITLALMGCILILALLHITQINHRSLISSLRARHMADISAQALQEAKTQWSQLSETAEAFALYNHRLHLLLWNNAYLDVIGLKPVQVRDGMRWRDMVALGARSPLGDDAALVMELDAANPVLQGHECHHRGRWLRSHFRKLPNGSLAVSHVDITELKDREAILVALQQDLRAARDAAETASQAKSRFLANMSHELRTPLNAVIGFADLMVVDCGRNQIDATRHESYARIISESGQHLLGIVSDMLDLARIEAGKIELVESETDLVDLARNAARIAAGRQHTQDVVITEAMPETKLRLRVDARLIRQALINLIGNAIKFSRPGGAILLRISDNADQIDVSVVDNGIGIPADRLAHVLEPFSQAENTESRRFGGVGLGLPLARQFVELHGGMLILESTEGVGTTATLRLPGTRRISA